MNTKRMLSAYSAIAVVSLFIPTVQAQGMYPAWQNATILTHAAPEQLFHTQSHLVSPGQRMQFRGELGLIHEQPTVPYRAIRTSFLTQERDQKPGKRDNRRPESKDASVDLLHKFIRGIEEKLHSTDDRKEQAELEKKLELAVRKLHEIEVDREHRDDRSDRDRHDGDHRNEGHSDEHHRDHSDHDHGDHHEPYHAELEKVRALHEAAERLEHGGLHDMAHQLHRQAEEIEQAIHRDHGPAPERMLMELLENMEQLRREVREVNERLDVIMKRVDRD